MAKSAGLLVLAWFPRAMDSWTKSVGVFWSNAFEIGQVNCVKREFVGIVIGMRLRTRHYLALTIGGWHLWKLR